MADPRLSIIPAGAVTDPNIEGRDLQVLCLLGRHIDDGGWCRRSQVKMARELHCARSTIQVSLARLVTAGWVQQRVEERPSGADSAHSYRVILDRDEPRTESMAEPDSSPQLDEGGADLSAGVPIQDRQGVPIHASAPMLTTPLNEGERDARAREAGEPTPDDVPDGELLAKLRGLAPTAAQDSVAETGASWRKLARDERREALARYPDWLADAKRNGRGKIAGLPTYLGEKRWTLLPARAAPSSTELAARVAAWSRSWWALVWRCLAAEAPNIDLLRQKFGMAQGFGGGWRIDPAERAALDEAAKALVAVPIDGDAARAWRDWSRQRGLAIAFPDKAEWIFVPAGTPSLAQAEDVGAVVMGMASGR